MNRSQLLARRADHRTSHLLHLVLSVITVGFWVPVWILVTTSDSLERGRIDRKIERLYRLESHGKTINCKCGVPYLVVEGEGDK